VNEIQPVANRPDRQSEIPVSTEIDVILNSYTFKVGRIVMWIPIRVLYFFNRLKGLKHE